MKTYKTCIPQSLAGFPCSQAHILLTCDQPGPKDNFLPIKNIRQFDTTAPLSNTSSLCNELNLKSVDILDQKLCFLYHCMIHHCGYDNLKNLPTRMSKAVKIKRPGHLILTHYATKQLEKLYLQTFILNQNVFVFKFALCSS